MSDGNGGGFGLSRISPGMVLVKLVGNYIKCGDVKPRTSKDLSGERQQKKKLIRQIKEDRESLTVLKYFYVEGR